MSIVRRILSLLTRVIEREPDRRRQWVAYRPSGEQMEQRALCIGLEVGVATQAPAPPTVGALVITIDHAHSAEQLNDENDTKDQINLEN